MNTSMSSLFDNTRGPSDRSSLPDPFVLYSTTQMPKTITDVLRLCEHIWLNSGQYKMSMQRIARYFLTSVVFDDLGDQGRKVYMDFLHDVLKIDTLLAELSDDFMCYGNSFTSLYMPFNRILFCDQCGLLRSIDSFKYNEFSFDLSKMKFHADCRRCDKRTPQTHKDVRSQDQSRVHVIRWSPHHIELAHNFFTGETEYIWKIPEEIKANVRKGAPLWIAHMPWEVLEAISKGMNFKFNKGVIYHMKEPVISGVQNRGWGIPRMLAAYKDIYYLQILKRYNEALALDYIVPFRVITPATNTGVDPLLNMDMGPWSKQVNEMLRQHRRDPAGWHTMPFPLQYQILSGEGVQLSPFQLIKQGTEDMQDALGTPVELFKGSLSVQAAPMAMRLFESQWPHLSAALNGWLGWLMESVGTAFNWKQGTPKLKRPTYADDLERKSILFQMASAQQISKETGFAPLGVDPAAEEKRMMEENRRSADAQREFQEQEMKKDELRETMAQMSMPPQQQMQGGMMPPGQPMGGMPGMQMPGEGMGPVTPQELLQQAEQMAHELMAMPETHRKSQLINLKRTNPVLHAQVKQFLENMTQQAATEGVAQMRMQAQQGGGMH